MFVLPHVAPTVRQLKVVKLIGTAFPELQFMIYLDAQVVWASEGRLRESFSA